MSLKSTGHMPESFSVTKRWKLKKKNQINISTSFKDRMKIFLNPAEISILIFFRRYPRNDFLYYPIFEHAKVWKFVQIFTPTIILFLRNSFDICCVQTFGINCQILDKYYLHSGQLFSKQTSTRASNIGPLIPPPSLSFCIIIPFISNLIKRITFPSDWKMIWNLI